MILIDFVYIVFNATFSNISSISYAWQPVLVVEEAGVKCTLFSSPNPKGHVSYLPSLDVRRPLTFSYFNLLLWNNWAKWNQTWQKTSI